MDNYKTIKNYEMDCVRCGSTEEDDSLIATTHSTNCVPEITRGCFSLNTIVSYIALTNEEMKQPKAAQALLHSDSAYVPHPLCGKRRLGLIKILKIKWKAESPQ